MKSSDTNQDKSLWNFVTNDTSSFASEIWPVVPKLKCTPYGESEFFSRITFSKLERLKLFMTKIGHANVLVPAPREYCAITVPLDHTCEIFYQGQPLVVDSTKAHILHWHEELDLKMLKPCRMLVVIFDISWINAYSQKLNTDDNFHNFSFQGMLFSNTESFSIFRRYLKFFWQEIERDSFLLHSSLALQEFENSLISLFLATLEESINNSKSYQNCYSQELCPPRYLRLVEEYLEEYLCNPFCIADLCEIVGVSPRTLNRNFKKYCGKTPKQFLKERRLEACRRDLLEADWQMVKVSDIALKYGFDHLGRFSMEYQRYFQELPSYTLRQ